MDEEAKVRAYAVLDGGAGIDEAPEAMAPGLVVAVAVELPQGTSVTMHVHGVGMLGAVVRVVRQEDTDDPVPSSLEGGQVAGVVEVLADEFSTTWQCVVHPHPTVAVRVAMALFSISGYHAWAARMAVGRKESMDPQFVMNLAGALTGHGVDSAVSLKVGLSVEQSTAFDGGAHGVDESVEVANEFIVLEYGQAVAQHPVGQGLHELSGLVGVKTGHEHGLGQLTHVSDELAVFGGLADFDFIETHVHLPCEAACLSLEGTNVIVQVKGKGSSRVAGAWVFGDVDDELSFIVTNVGFSLCDQRSSTSAPLSSPCIDNFSIFIVHFGHCCSPRQSKYRHSI